MTTDITARARYVAETLEPELDTRSPTSFFEEANERLGL